MNIYIAHSRTSGSKNGVRKYQYEDGRWTPEGLERRRSEYAQTKGKRVAKGVITGVGAAGAAAGIGAGVYTASKTKGGWDRATEKGAKDKPSPSQKIANASKDVTSSAKDMANAIDDSMTPYTNDLSNQELKNMIERMRLENDYSNLSKQTIEKGKDWVTPTVAAVASVAAITASTATIITAIRDIKG